MSRSLLKRPKTFGLRPAHIKLVHDLARRADARSDSAMMGVILDHIVGDTALQGILVMEAKVKEQEGEQTP